MRNGSMFLRQADREGTDVNTISIDATNNETNQQQRRKLIHTLQLQVLHKEKSISGNVARQLPRRITINQGKEGIMKAAKYTPEQMRLIGY